MESFHLLLLLFPFSFILFPSNNWYLSNLGTRSFTKASDLFRKKKSSKSSKAGRNAHHPHRHSIHLAVPEDDAGETTTDYEEADSDASTDDLLDEGTFLFFYHQIFLVF